MSLFGISGGTASGGGKISNGQAVLILMGTVLSFTVFIFPGPSVELAGNDAYWAPALATIPSIAQMGLFWALARRFGYKSPYDYLPRLLGPGLGTLVSASYVVVFLISGAAVEVQAGLVLAAVLMPLTPLALFTVMTVLTAAYAAYLGMETFGRLAQLMMPVLLAVLVLITVGLLGQLDYGFLLPILRHGFRPAWRAAALPMAMRSEAALVLAFLLPLMRSPGRGLRAGVLASCLIAVFLVMLFVTVICLVSPGDAVRQTAPVLQASRMVVITRGLEHVEFLVIAPWLIALVLKVALYVHLASVGMARVAGLRRWQPLVLPAAVLTGVLGSWMLPNIQTLLLFLTRIWPGYALTMNTLLPLSLLLVAVVLGRGENRPGRGSDAE